MAVGHGVDAGNVYAVGGDGAAADGKGVVGAFRVQGGGQHAELVGAVAVGGVQRDVATSQAGGAVGVGHQQAVEQALGGTVFHILHGAVVARSRGIGEGGRIVDRGDGDVGRGAGAFGENVRESGGIGGDGNVEHAAGAGIGVVVGRVGQVVHDAVDQAFGDAGMHADAVDVKVVGHNAAGTTADKLELVIARRGDGAAGCGQVAQRHAGRTGVREDAAHGPGVRIRQLGVHVEVAKATAHLPVKLDGIARVGGKGIAGNAAAVHGDVVGAAQ